MNKPNIPTVDKICALMQAGPDTNPVDHAAKIKETWPDQTEKLQRLVKRILNQCGPWPAVEYWTTVYNAL